MVADYRAGIRGAFAHGAPGAPLDTEPGYRRLRPLVGTGTVVTPAAAALIRDEAGRVLLMRRCDTGRWVLPGGAVELGERVDTALVREVEEEVGLEVVPVELVAVISGPELQMAFPNGDRIQAVTAFFTCRVAGGTPEPDGVEAAEVRFFGRGELPRGPGWMARLRRYLDAVPAGPGFGDRDT
jgi:ADP-ribose pyrophosphatase YjhB (NUDIX family)